MARHDFTQRTEWTDPRLSDLATIVHENDGRLDVVEGIARDAARDAAAIVAAAARRKERSWTLEVLLIGVLASQVLQLIGAHL